MAELPPMVAAAYRGSLQAIENGEEPVPILMVRTQSGGEVIMLSARPGDWRTEVANQLARLGSREFVIVGGAWSKHMVLPEVEESICAIFWFTPETQRAWQYSYSVDNEGVASNAGQLRPMANGFQTRWDGLV